MGLAIDGKGTAASLCQRMIRALNFLEGVDIDCSQPKRLELLRKADVVLHELCHEVFQSFLREKFLTVSSGGKLSQGQLSSILTCTGISTEDAAGIVAAVDEGGSGNQARDRINGQHRFFGWLCTSPWSSEGEDAFFELKRLVSCTRRRASLTASADIVVSSLLNYHIIEPLQLNQQHKVYNLKLYDGDALNTNLAAYYSLCKSTSDLVITTSCFPAWRTSGRKNVAGKVIPAIPRDSDRTRVFFFDDNMNLTSGGTAMAPGVCNLRNIVSQDFVDFTAGSNGFEQSHAFDHTIIHSSAMFRCTLVQANILDAVSNRDYFTKILATYAEPDEQIIVFTDVNATILMEDTIEGKGASELLLTTMFALSEITVREPLTIQFSSQTPVVVTKTISLKQLVFEIAAKDTDYYNSFWNRHNCRQCLELVLGLTEVRWTPTNALISQELFWNFYKKYNVDMHLHPTVNGIALSWFECFKTLTLQGHKAVVNSFGVDTRRVLTNTIVDESNVVQIVIDYELWSQRDKNEFIVSLNR